MERNWLIRTSQNQILGPVAKQKLLEFIQKGALGMTDEVTSGNGYWFSIKEKELVEKYIYGDVPQSYNPISESKSVLSNREHPEKTTSINTAPANKTQVIKLSSIPGILPKEDDLAFPDLGVSAAENTKLPNEDDLAFPDMDDILSFAAQESTLPKAQATQNFEVKKETLIKATPVVAPVQESNEEVVFPDEDDLAFPDMDEMKTSPKIEKGKVDLSAQYTRTVALDTEQSQEVFPEKKSEERHPLSPAKVEHEMEDDFGDFPLALDVTGKGKATEDDFPEEIKHPPLQAVRKERPVLEDRKLLHDRKTKSSVAGSKSAAALRDPTREVAHAAPAEPLKKRNDNYLFFILIIIVMIIIAVFFYFKEILNKPLPV